MQLPVNFEEGVGSEEECIQNAEQTNKTRLSYEPHGIEPRKEPPTGGLKN
jgi:hypothetical protein